MEALGVGDLHMTDSSGSGALSKYIQEPDAMVINEFEAVIAYGRSHGINRIFQYGDVCDGPRMSYEAMIALSDFLDRNDDFEFDFILGNHDMYGETSKTGHSLQLLKKLYRKPNVRFHLRPRTVNIDGVPVRFLPYPAEDFDSKALNVYHKEVRGAQNDHGRPFDDEKLPASKAITVAGHLHTAHRIRNTFFSGTLYQQNFGENLPKYFHHIQFNNVKDYSVDLIDHDPVYKLHNVILQTRDDLALIPKGDKNLVKLVIQDGCDVSASDYADYTNIAITKNFKSREDLQAVLTEDLAQGQELVIRTEDFFKEWLAALDVDDAMRKQIRAVRRRILNGVKA